MILLICAGRQQDEAEIQNQKRRTITPPSEPYVLS